MASNTPVDRPESPNALTDAGVGRAIFTTRLQLSIQAAIMCLYVAIVAFLLPMGIWLFDTSPRDLDLVKVDLRARYSSSQEHSRWRVRDKNGERSVLTLVRPNGEEVQLMTPAQVRLALKPFRNVTDFFYLMVKLSVGVAVFGYVVTWLFLRRTGSGNQRNRRLRGAFDLVTGAELSKIVQERGASRYTLADVSIPKTAPVTGILIQGSQGSGKSLAIHDLMRQAFRRKKKCIIYDQSGEFFRAYYRPGIDYFFNPACEGSVNWSIFKELQYSYHADLLAEAFLPKGAKQAGGATGFFEDAARAVFSVILLRLAQRGAINTSDIAKAFLEMPADEMEHLIEKSVASSAIGGDSKGQRQGVISSISIYLNGISAVQPGEWSLREFLDRKDDVRFFILSTEDTRAMFAPLYRLIITVASELIAAKGEIVHEDRYWFWLDEIHTLGDIKIDTILATLRKFGVSAVAGIQSQSQFVSAMGQERAQTVMNCFNTVLALRANEPEMRKQLADRIDKQDIDMANRNQALSVAEWRDGASINRNEQEKYLVMPAEFGQLDPLVGFLATAGSYPVAKVDYRSWLEGGFLRRPRVSAFEAVQELPPRHPRFLIERRDDIDAFEGVRQEVAVKKAQAAEEAAAAEAAEREAQEARAKADVDSDTGELKLKPSTRVQPGQAERGPEHEIDHGGIV